MSTDLKEIQKKLRVPICPGVEGPVEVSDKRYLNDVWAEHDSESHGTHLMSVYPLWLPTWTLTRKRSYRYLSRLTLIGPRQSCELSVPPHAVCTPERLVTSNCYNKPEDPDWLPNQRCLRRHGAHAYWSPLCVATTTRKRLQVLEQRSWLVRGSLWTSVLRRLVHSCASLQNSTTNKDPDCLWTSVLRRRVHSCASLQNSTTNKDPHWSVVGEAHFITVLIVIHLGIAPPLPLLPRGDPPPPPEPRPVQTGSLGRAYDLCKVLLQTQTLRSHWPFGDSVSVSGHWWEWVFYPVPRQLCHWALLQFICLGSGVVVECRTVWTHHKRYRQAVCVEPSSLRGFLCARTFLCVDELSGHVFRDDGVGQFPQEELQDAGHRHHVPGVAQVGVPRALERRLDTLHDPRVPVYTENSLVVQSYNINNNNAFQ